MRRDTVHIRKIEIDRALGIRRGEGFTLSDMSPGINLVFGPNGSGKTTTCRVVQELLWPGGIPRPSVSGIIRDADDEWRIDIDVGHAQAHRNGQSAALPDFGSRENRSRYLLGLKDLIVDDNNKHADFAKAIADASQGGYDLEKAADALAFRTRPKSRKSECDRAHKCDHDVQEARRTQIQVEREADRLADLRQQLNDSISAGRELELLEKAREYHDAVGRCRDLKLEIDTYPEGIGHLQGDEREHLSALEDEERRLIEQKKAEEDRHWQAQKELDYLALPNEGIADERLLELRALKRSLRDAEVRKDEEQRRRDEAVGIAGDALNRLGDYVTEEQLSLMRGVENSDLGEFARKVHRLRAKEEVLSECRSWLAQEEPEDTRSLLDDELREGISILTRWLASPIDSTGGGRPSRLSAVAMLLLIATAVALAITAAWLWVLVLFVAVGLLGADWWRGPRQSKVTADNAREIYRTSYTSLSLPKPDVWDDDTVLALLRSLVRLNGKKALFTERRTRLDQMKENEEGLDRAREELERQRLELESQLGLSLEIGDDWLPVLVDRIREWQKAVSQVAAAEAALAGIEREREDLIGRINRSLSDYGYRPIRTSDAADELTADLERRRNRHDSAREVIRHADERIELSIIPSLENAASKRSNIFRRLGITDDQKAILGEWLSRYSRYRELKEMLAKEDAVCSDRAIALADRTDLLELDKMDIDLKIRTCEAAAEKRDDLSQTIGEINRQIKDAKTGHALSDALEKRDEALLALAEARDENGRAVTGAALTDWVRQEAIERSRPQVFRRANELFVRFTRGTLRLEMDDRAAPPAFAARRGSFPFQSLNELSDGERIQLMTAVRLAFLEQDEARRLPLLVDEVLGTSDDGRSGVLIDTMIEIARQGRQVFYCTAQHDEVGKWKARLREANVPFKVLDLGEIRSGATQRTEPLEIAVFETADPPRPRGMCYEDYGDALRVPALDPTAETIDGVHLWHVLDDSELLFQLLCKSITTWSQLQTLLAHGGAGLIENTNGTFDRANAAAKAIRCACEAWRIGRGKPVDRAVLLDSECVTDRFIDELTRLARHLDGDGAEIIRALDERVVSNWRSDNTERLREYFEEEGYLSTQTPLTHQNLRIHVFAAVAEELRSGVLEQAFVDRIVAEMYSSTEVEAEVVYPDECHIAA